MPGKRNKHQEAKEVSVKDVHQSEDFIVHLPEEITMKIFSYLDSASILNGVSLVCKKWKKLAFDRYLWRTVSLKPLRRRRGFAKFLSKFSHAETLSIRYRFIGDIFLIKLSRLTCLNSLSIVSCDGCCYPSCEICCHENCENYSNDDDHNFKQVDYLKFDEWELVEFEKSFRMLLKICTTLEKVSLGEYLGPLRNRMINIINSIFLINCKTLKIFQADFRLFDKALINLSKCSELTELHIPQAMISKTTLIQIMTLSNLKALKVDGWYFSSWDLWHVFNGGKFVNLTTFELNYCKELRNFHLELFANKYQKLQHFYLYSCYNVTDIGLAYVIEKCTQLTHLSLRYLENVNGHCLSEINNDINTNLQRIVLDRKLYNSPYASALMEAKPELDIVLLYDPFY